VIASGCTDRTVEIVQKIRAARAKSPTQSLHVQTSLRLIIQKERAGKSSAVNLFIKEARENILVLESADTIPAPRTIEHLCAPFLASAGAPAPAAHPAPAAAQPVGLAGAHPVPTNSAKTFIGFCVKTMWEMHHQIALKSPKCGELIAFRRALPAEPATPAIVPGLSSAPGTELKPGTPILTDIPAESAVDEASIEAEILKHNLKIIYVPEAIVYNKGPETVREFIAQRRRIAAGHIWLQKNFQHKISTNNKLSVISLTLSRFSLNPKNDLRLIGMMFLEITAKLLGSYDFYFKKSRHTIWERIGTTKNPNK
jgi:cellulose synthase/poly-beta-1,6-N-acetylglucosamine synthase-like glycosyltransferase